MNYKMVGRVLGMVLLCLAGLMLVPLLAGIIYGENVRPFVLCIALSLALGLALASIKPDSTDLFARDGFLAVGLAWMIMSLLGALPYILSGDIPDFVDALFESVSGFSTTGATVLTDVEALSRSCMLWRLLSQWIGGMGVLVFMLAVMPMSGEHSMHIVRAEFPGPTVGKLVPRVRETAKILYLIYIGMTLLEFVLLACGGMSIYEALGHAFASAGTGGFSTRNASLGEFNSMYIEVVATVFELLFSVNFYIYYCILTGRARTALKNEELHCFVGIVLFAVVSIAINLYSRGYYGSIATALHQAFFNVSMSISTSSFATVDYTLWPQYSKWMLLMLMLVGGCAGSTCGGLKLSRAMILVKTALSDLRRMAHPRSVNPVQIDGKRVAPETVKAVHTYFVLYIFIILSCTLLISLDGFDTATNFSAALACLSNIGPGIGVNGPYGNYSMFSDASKLLLSFVMLLGRLELYPILVMLMPSTWRR